MTDALSTFDRAGAPQLYLSRGHQIAGRGKAPRRRRQDRGGQKGRQFSPRLADAGEAVFWRVHKSANYGALDELARGCVDLSKAEDQWDEMMRTAGSLKLVTIHASELIRSSLKSARPSGLAQAIMEVGRVNKTLYLLNY